MSNADCNFVKLIANCVSQTRGTKPLELKESTQSGVYVKDLSCYVVNNVSELEKLKNLGEKNRAVASTNMNKHSSRSHTIFSMTIEAIQDSGDKPQGALRMGKLHLVDLAGSERQSKTGTTGDRLKEAAKINLSLDVALARHRRTHRPKGQSCALSVSQASFMCTANETGG